MQLPITSLYTPFGTYGTNRMLPPFTSTTTFVTGENNGILVAPYGTCPLSQQELNGADTSRASALILSNGHTLMSVNRQQHLASALHSQSSSTTNTSEQSRRPGHGPVSHPSPARAEATVSESNHRTTKTTKAVVENRHASDRATAKNARQPDANEDCKEVTNGEPEVDDISKDEKLSVEHGDVSSMNGEETQSSSGTDSGMSLHADPTSTTEEDLLHHGQSNKDEDDNLDSIEGENKTNLIVNYLPQHMSQEEIRALFSSIGAIISCKLIRDKSTGQSLGYGFVNYSRPEDAEKAVSMLNGLRLQNKIIKVSVARPSSETIKGANLYICGLSKNMSQPEMEKLFAPYGKIITSRILYDINTGLSKGVGFIRFDQRHEADLAIKHLHGYVIPGTNEPITVKFANSPTNSIAKSAHQHQSTVYASTSEPNRSSHQAAENKLKQKSSGNNVSITSTQMDFMTTPHSLSTVSTHPLNMSAPNGVHLFTASPLPHPTFFPVAPHLELAPSGCPLPLSTAHPCHMSINPPQGIPTIPAHHLLLHHGHAPPAPPSQALSNFSTLSTVGGHKCSPAQLTHLPHSYHSVTLFVSNLPPEADDTLLWYLFGQFGTPCSVKAVKDSNTLSNGTRRCKGFGFVTMSSYEEALVAMHYINGFNLGNRILHVNFKASNRTSQQPATASNGKFNTYDTAMTSVILRPLG